MEDFDAAALEAAGEPAVFRLGGEAFEVTRVPAGAILTLARNSLDDVGLLESYKNVDECIRACLQPDDLERWEKATYNADLRAVLEVVPWLVARSTGRPTTPPSASVSPPSADGTASNSTSRTKGSRSKSSG